MTGRMAPMEWTDAEALAEARRRWGADAQISTDTTTCMDLYLVGVHPEGAEPTWHGAGRSWALAFAEADLRASREEAERSS